MDAVECAEADGGWDKIIWHLVYLLAIFKRKAAGFGASEGGEGGAAAEFFADVADEGTYICTFGTIDEDSEFGERYVENFDAVDSYFAGRSVDCLAFSCYVI